MGPLGGARGGRTASVVAAVFVATLGLALRRRLTFDEAYYLGAARDLLAGRLTLPDHPPLLPALLALTDGLPLPVELRVRLVSASIAAATALALGALAAATGGGRARATWLAAVGVLPLASGLVATPDGPLLLGVTLLLLGAARDDTRLAGGGALLATLAKVSGGLAAGLVALELLARHRRRTALAIGVGALLATPLAARSLVLQAGHALGHGPLVSAPWVGAPTALAAWAAGALLLIGPPVLLRARGLGQVPGGSLLVSGILVALATSALVSGRPPEVGWIGPALPALLAIASRAPWSPAARAAYLGPTLVGVALWLVPGGPFEDRAPTPGRAWPVAPPYGRAAWQRVYPNIP